MRYDATKGDRFLVLDEAGNLIRGATWVDTDECECGVLYVGNACIANNRIAKTRDMSIALRTIRGNFKVIYPYAGPMNRRGFIEGLIKANDWRFGAEIGVAKGNTTFHLLKACPGLNLIAVDYWPGHFARRGITFRQRMKKSPSADRLKLIQMASVEGAKLVPDESLDFVFIDADHSEKGCSDDIKAWLPKIKPNGMILGHDYNWDSVRVAVNGLINDVYSWPIDAIWYKWKREINGT